ncbi:MAG: putative toxin-antitoxin system toxin component, PIN family [Terrimicrobiaceae bacterium]
MTPSYRWVVDTNTLISHLLLPESIPTQAVRKALDLGDLLVSDATLEELTRVLARPKFEKYLPANERREFFNLLSRVARRIEIRRPVAACRDVRDDKFLEVAINGKANAIISGDLDLLALHPFLGIPILTPRQFLDRAFA